MRNKKYYVERAAAIIAAVILIQTLYFKFTAHPDSVKLFTELGAEPVGRIGLGCLELITGILLLYRKTSHIGAIIGVGMMIGAIVSHVAIIGINFNNDGGTLFTLACVTLVCCIVVLLTKDVKLPILGKR
ncbi:DoxX family protein [Galbibacter pacificus]|uniref:DoxX family protein n=1 Tax=Galbibacter pacificus TaxID=2996052 RepID=A0ABT6FUY8_9FLAO|nr:DoxX family protein [Galbibacter pacificus]MDG3583613.1 DoxX family protein [Galbibacter pacificus]MDG3586911.1 DoxX family protein [Galbibacter pacificus]